MATTVSVVIKAIDQTTAAIRSAESRLVKFASFAGKTLLAGFGLGLGGAKLLSFFKGAMDAAAEADSAIGLRMQHLGDTFTRFQVNVGKALLGDAGFTKDLEGLIGLVEQAFVPALKTMVHWVNQFVEAFKAVDHWQRKASDAVRQWIFGQDDPGPNQDFSDVTSGSSSQRYGPRPPGGGRGRGRRDGGPASPIVSDLLFDRTSSARRQELIAGLIPDPEAIAAALDKALGDQRTGIGAMVAQMQFFGDLRDQFAAQLSHSIVDGFAAGIEMAIMSGSLGDGFKALTGTLLSGLGSAMIEFGAASLITAKLMEAIKSSLAKFLPGGAIVASLAMIAFGATLRGVAGRVFSSMGSVQQRATGQSTARSVGAAENQGQLTVLLPREAYVRADDPKFQAFIAEVIARGAGRNITFRPA